MTNCSKIFCSVILLAILSLLTILAGSAIAASDSDFIRWHSSNAQLLRGYDYQLASKQQTIVTLEHAHGHSFGDFYSFLDYSWPDFGDSSYYLEVAPRFSLTKITSNDYSFGLVKDILISSMIEKPQAANKRYLYGVAFDLKLAGFKYFKTNFFVRNDPGLQKTYQVTISWHRKFKISNSKFVIEGFSDLAGDAGPGKVTHQLVVPRFLMDISNTIGAPENRLFVGIEWQYWRNKFGVDGIIESVAQLQIKYNL